MTAVYAQSGGLTAVINSSAAGLIDACRINNCKLYASKNGILGVIQENLYNVSELNQEFTDKLKYTPGAIFGSCRYKLTENDYKRLIDVFSAHNIKYFFYNGGNDSADTCLKVSRMAKQLNYKLNAVHIPKTIDNDLASTDNSPGFGSAAKYIAISTMEASIDLQSMPSTQVFILETMGRNAGWLAAASGVIKNHPKDPPHIILFPEVVFNEAGFIKQVESSVINYGYCVVVASEGIKNAEHQLISSTNQTDSFGHSQLGGVAPMLANIIRNKLKYKCHWAVPDYLQRSATHIASKTDAEQAYSVGYKALEYAMNGNDEIMIGIKRTNNRPYQWETQAFPLSMVANYEKTLPVEFIANDKTSITAACREYIVPLIYGESYPTYKNGIPDNGKLEIELIEKLCPQR